VKVSGGVLEVAVARDFCFPLAPFPACSTHFGLPLYIAAFSQLVQFYRGPKYPRPKLKEPSPNSKDPPAKLTITSIQVYNLASAVLLEQKTT